jgi:site-specific recombinase XerD
MIPNKLESVKHARLKLLHCFKILLSSGMRVGELVNIDFTRDPCQRIVTSILDKSQMAEIIINTEKTCKKREIYVPLDSYEFMKHDKRPLTRSMIIKSFIEFRKHMHLPFNLTAHVCRRTLATMMHESGVDVATIAMVLGNTPGVVMNHYILSSGRNYDACEIAYAKMSGVLTKTNNVFVNRE